jgi:hypothetical protein
MKLHFNYQTKIERKALFRLVPLQGFKKFTIPKSTTAFKVLKEEIFKPFQINISKDLEYKEQYQDASIAIDKNSVLATAQIEILKLRKKIFLLFPEKLKALLPMLMLIV